MVARQLHVFTTETVQISVPQEVVVQLLHVQKQAESTCVQATNNNRYFLTFSINMMFTEW